VPHAIAAEKTRQDEQDIQDEGKMNSPELIQLILSKRNFGEFEFWKSPSCNMLN